MSRGSRKGSDLDLLICEYFSHRLYKEGKDPIIDVNPQRRIKGGIWRDEGIDLTRLSKEGIVFDRTMKGSGLFMVETIKVRGGFFRKMREHRLLVGLEDISGLDLPDKTVDMHERDSAWLTVDALAESKLLLPLVLIRSSSLLRELSGRFGLERRPQKEMPSLSAANLRRQVFGEGGKSAGVDDLSHLFHRKVPKGEWLTLKGGMKASDLSSLITALFDMEDETLRGLIGSGRVQTFIRNGLKSPSLEEAVNDMMVDPDGNPEGPDEFRTRFGRWLSEGDMADMVSKELIGPKVESLISCSPEEASKVERALGPLIDHRSTVLLSDILFKVSNENRGCVMRLMARTGDQQAAEHLKKILEFSTVDEDRSNATAALSELGVDVPRGSSGKR